MVRPQLLAVPILASVASAVSFDCARLVSDGVRFDLSRLGGPRSVSYVEDQPPSVSNTTFTIDICQPLKKDSELDDAEQCPTGTRVCAVERDYNTVENTTTVHRVIPIAGDFQASSGRTLDPKITRLKNSASNSDSEKEGLIVELSGGKYPDQKGGRVQRAVIQFECDPTRTGLEGLETSEDSEELARRDEEQEPTPLVSSLQFKSYKVEDEIEVLRLTWWTKYGCEDVPADDDDDRRDSSKSWGFFGWFFIILFLGVAAYLIFGSWLNYSRYGARGWDLLPHGDTIRDLPYVIKDWGRTVKDVVGSRGQRGGYSAV